MAASVQIPDATMAVIVPLAKASGTPVSQFVATLCEEAIAARSKPVKAPRARKPTIDPGAYSQSFNDFWMLRSWTGSKKEAYGEWVKAGLDKKEPLREKIASAVAAQVKSKSQLTAAGQFASPFPHACRWIKHARWEDNIETPETLNDPNRIGYTNADCEKYLSGKEGWTPEKLWAYWVDAFNADRGTRISPDPFVRTHRSTGREDAVRAFVAVVRS